jgi:hypothetical protein
MWRNQVLIPPVLFVLLAGGILPSDTANGGEPSASQTAPPLTTRQKWVRFAIMQGRVTANAALGQTATLSCEAEHSDRSETFGVHCTTEGTNVRYILKEGGETTAFHFSSSQELLIQRTPDPSAPGDNLPLQFRQVPGRDIEVVLGEPEVGPSYQAPTLWHLMLTEPELAQREIIPLLERLRPEWNLAWQGKQVESLLVERPLRDALPPLEELVQQLGDPRFDVRRRADLELRSFGTALLPLLEQLDTRSLSAEQRLRVRELKKASAVVGDDSPQEVAGWMTYDGRLGRKWLAEQPGERHEFARRQQDVLLRSRTR